MLCTGQSFSNKLGAGHVGMVNKRRASHTRAVLACMRSVIIAREWVALLELDKDTARGPHV